VNENHLKNKLPFLRNNNLKQLFAKKRKFKLMNKQFL
jgi:hypothetical protein